MPETAEEREARLRKMTASNHARLAAETAEEREARLQSDRVLVRHRQQQVMQAQLPLLQQSSRRISRRGVKEFLALCSTLKLYSLQFEEVPVTPPGGNVKYYALWAFSWQNQGSVSYLEDCL